MKVAIIQYSTYGHITTMARAVQQGVLESGLASSADLFQVPETLPQDVLELIHAPEKPDDIPEATVSVFKDYDSFLFGIPTRFGNLPAQWVDFWGKTGELWTQGSLYGKPAAIFVSTGTPGGGQEATVKNALTYLAHHGMPYISLGYTPVFPEMTNLDEIHGGSAWGAGTYAGADGSKQPSELETRVARIQGNEFAKAAIKFMKNESSQSPQKDITKTRGDQKPTDTPVNQTNNGEKKSVVKETREKQSTKTTKPDAKSGCKCIIV